METSAIAFALLFLWASGISPAIGQSSDPTEPMCYDWGESSEAAVSVIEGEAGWLSCPLFSHPSVYNYTSSQNAGHNLFWYRLPEGHDLEQPITYSSRLSKDRERLWLQPAADADAGQYICMLRNKSSCSKIAMRLKVLQPDQVAQGDKCPRMVTTAASQVVIPLQEGKFLDCPDLQDAAKMADGEPTVAWYHVIDGPKCDPHPFWNSNRQQKGARLGFYNMLLMYQGLYLCTISYTRRGQTLNFTRSVNVTPVYPSTVPKDPTILHPYTNRVFTVKLDTEVHLACTALFPYLDSGTWDIWWTVDGKTLDKLGDRFSKINRQVKYDLGDRTEESVLVIQNFQSEDLKREYNCSVRNARGAETRRAQLQEEGEEDSKAFGTNVDPV